jgi:hypothetical protein
MVEQKLASASSSQNANPTQGDAPWAVALQVLRTKDLKGFAFAFLRNRYMELMIVQFGRKSKRGSILF